MTEKVLCPECHWHGLNSEALSAPNPFDLKNVVTGCPRCKSVDSLLVACDEPGCWRETSCGTPTPLGYRRTCSTHAPRTWRSAS